MNPVEIHDLQCELYTARAHIAEILRKQDEIKVFIINRLEDLQRFDEIFERDTLDESVALTRILEKFNEN